ncbi:unnamed protein product [Phytomonas sp. Hart1]|nr:unnamed protein product [Phytomonas sp. Hart1]|eukprot:CCW70122.1 unnamed protein product [Phytomonas sp. isolate Hart1]
MCLAKAALNAIHYLCDVPVAIYNYVLEYYVSCMDTQNDCNTKSKLLFLVGQTAFKQLIAVKSSERPQLTALEELTKSLPVTIAMIQIPCKKNLGWVCTNSSVTLCTSWRRNKDMRFFQWVRFGTPFPKKLYRCAVMSRVFPLVTTR